MNKADSIDPFVRQHNLYHYFLSSAISYHMITVVAKQDLFIDYEFLGILKFEELLEIRVL